MRFDRGIVSGLAVVLLWASAFPAVQVATRQLGAVGLCLVRLAVATGALLAVAAIRDIRPPRFRELGWVLAAGFFGVAAYQLLLNTSELHVDANTASIIVAASPVVSVATAWALFREPVNAMTVVGSGVALGGVTLVCLARSGVTLSAGVWIVVGAMIVHGISHPLQRPLLRTHTPLEVATYTIVAGTVMILPIAPAGWDELTSSSAGGWLAACYLGLFPSALGFALWGDAIGRLTVAAATSLLYLVPPCAVLIAWVWLGDVPIAAELLGGGIVIAGVVVVSHGARIRTRVVAGVRRAGRPVATDDPATVPVDLPPGRVDV